MVDVRHCGRETWCSGHNEIGILQRTAKVLVTAMCGVNFVDRKKKTCLLELLPGKNSLHLVLTCIDKGKEQCL